MYVTGQVGAYDKAATKKGPASNKKCMLHVRFGPKARQPIKMSLLAVKIACYRSGGGLRPVLHGKVSLLAIKRECCWSGRGLQPVLHGKVSLLAVKK